MTNYLAGRLLSSLLGLFVATFVVFGMLRLIPGDVVQHLLEGRYDPAAEEQLREQLGLNEPVPQAYVTWLGGLVRGDLGESLSTGDSVRGMIQQRLPVTLELSVLALVCSMLVAFPVGVLAAVKQGSTIDYVLRGISVVFMSVPFFWLAALVISVPARTIEWTPPIGYEHFWDDPRQNLSVLIVPALVLGMNLAGVTMRILRTVMLEVLRLDYVRTARAKGLSERTVVVRHALRNALVPVVTIVGLEFAFLMGGTVIVETVFGLPGMGRLMLDSLTVRDYNVIVGVTVVYAAILVLTNLVVDLSYGVLNPRMRA